MPWGWGKASAPQLGTCWPHEAGGPWLSVREDREPSAGTVRETPCTEQGPVLGSSSRDTMKGLSRSRPQRQRCRRRAPRCVSDGSVFRLPFRGEIPRDSLRSPSSQRKVHFPGARTSGFLPASRHREGRRPPRWHARGLSWVLLPGGTRRAQGFCERGGRQWVTALMPGEDQVARSACPASTPTAGLADTVGFTLHQASLEGRLGRQRACISAGQKSWGPRTPALPR